MLRLRIRIQLLEMRRRQVYLSKSRVQLNKLATMISL